MHIENQLMLRYHVVVRDSDSFGQASRAATEKSRRCGLFRGFQVVKAHPVLLASLEKLVPRSESRRDILPERVENEDIALRNTDTLGSSLQRAHNLWLRNQKSSLRCFKVVLQLHRRVRWVRAGENPTGAHNRQDQHTVINLPLSSILPQNEWWSYIIEGMNRDTVALPNTPCLQSRDQLADQLPGLVARD